MSFGGGSGSSSISGSTDVVLNSPTNNQVLGYNSGLAKWQNQAAPSAPVTSVAGKTGAVTLTAADAGAVPTTNKGAANGVATLDGTTHVPTAQIPDLSSTYAAIAGLGNSSTKNVGTTTGTVAAGDDSRFSAGGSLPLVYQNDTPLPSTWDLAITSASFLDTAAMGTLLTLGAPSDAFEVEWSGNTPVISDDGTIMGSAPASVVQYRSEVIFTSDLDDGGHDYTNMRFVAGQRIRVAFDVLTAGLNARDSGAWSLVFQGIGRAQDGSTWPGPCITLVVEQGGWRLCGGASLTYSQAVTQPHEDGRWYRFELDILLGGPGTGTIKWWMDGASCGTWTPTSGTYYAGNGNTALDLQWIYFKNGLYGGATTQPYPVKALFRNRRFSVTSVDGSTTTTWRGPQNHTPGLNIFKRNPTTGMPY